MPAPMMAPTLRAVSDTGPSERFSVCSPPSSASFSSQSIGFFASSGLPIPGFSLARKNCESDCGVTLRPRRRRPCQLPKGVHRQTEQNDDQAGPSVLRFIPQQLDFEKSCHHDVKCGKNGIAEGAVGAGHVRALEAEDEQAAQREDVEQKLRKDQKIEQLA